MIIANRVRELRRANGLTLREVAQTLGITYQAIANIETYITGATDDTKVKIAAYFHMPVHEVFDFNKEGHNEHSNHVR